MAASRDTSSLKSFSIENQIHEENFTIHFFDAADFDSHNSFYQNLPQKPTIVVYAAGFLRTNEEVFDHFHDGLQMMQVNYAGAVSVLNLLANDPENKNLKRIVGISSLSGVRGRRSNFMYGSTKAAFTTYLAGLRQHLAPRQVTVNVIISGYIRTKINAGLQLNESLMMEPEFVARHIVRAGKGFAIVPGWKWKIIYQILKLLPEFLVARMP